MHRVVYPKRYKADPVPDDVKVKKLTGPNQLFFMNLIRSCGSFTLREVCRLWLPLPASRGRGAWGVGGVCWIAVTS